MNNIKVGEKLSSPIYSATNYSFQIDLTFSQICKKRNNSNDVFFTGIKI